MNQVPAGTGSAGRAERHVFATADGSTRRSVRWVGRLTAVAMTAWLVALIAGGSGFAALPQLPSYVALHAHPGAHPARAFASATNTRRDSHAATHRI
jgi:hypothetical protein